MNTKKILLFIAFLMVCGLFLMTCEPKERNCTGDGHCYVDRDNERKRCGDRGCIAYQTVIFTKYDGYKKHCDCY